MMTRRFVLSTLMLGALPWGVSGCRSWLPRSDAERAAEEREQAKKRLESSLTLVPYRVFKTMLRASKVTPPPPEFAELSEVFQQIEKLDGALKETKVDWTTTTQQLINLVAALYRGRAILNKTDEDRFPLLWTARVDAPVPATWYDGPAEHLLLATVLMAVDVAMNKDPLTDALLYELSRAPAQEAWPPALKVWSQAARGLMYMQAGYHFAAEEELTRYLATVPELSAQALKELQNQNYGSSQAAPLLALLQQTPVLLAVGYLMRAVNRFALKRSDPAYDDLEAMLQQLNAAGIDGELSQWGWAMVHIHRHRYDEATVDLARLAQSPYLSPEERAEIKSCSENMRELGKDKGFVLLGAQRAQLVIIRALIARAGGIQVIFAQLLGPELAAKAYAPLSFLSAVSDQLHGQTQGALQQGGELGNKGLQFLKEQLKR